MNTIEKSGKTVEDALEAGLRELNLSSSDVDIEVLEYGSPGIFGMFGKLARVRLTVKKQDDDFDFDMPTLSLDQQAPSKPKAKAAADKPKQEKKQKPEAAKADRQQKPGREKDNRQDKAATDKPVQDKPAQNKAEADEVEAPKATREKPKVEKRSQSEPSDISANYKPARPKRERPPKAQSERAHGQRAENSPRKPKAADGESVHNRPVDTTPMEPMTMEDLPPVNPDELSEDAKKAHEVLSQLTKLMGVDVEIRLREKEGQLLIQMMGDTLGVLIGRRGETLDAIQYLTSLKVNKGRDEYLRVTLDTEHYRAKREEALRRLAERMANRARKTGRRVALEPMNPYERRVMHSALQDNEYVQTHSEGEDPYRRVIITLK
ncbi:MAG: RNA-binding cell elongation regulator Jag/EloR [Clostridia bacterium]|nr:RNA-binding cell elongation regulator Jag/EloR [Clostridia bacterium]